MKGSILAEKSYAFALRIIGLYKYLTEKKVYRLADQVLGSGTSIAANIEEALGGTSNKEFILRLTIACREARETMLWINLLKDSGYLDTKISTSLIEELTVIMKMINKTRTTMKKKIRLKTTV